MNDKRTGDTHSEPSAEKRTEIIRLLISNIQDNFVVPERAYEISKRLEDRLASGVYDGLATAYRFAQVVTADLFTFSQDRHLRFWYDPLQVSESAGDDTEKGDLLHQHFQRTRRSNFGFARVERLAGNIGYMDLRELPPVSVAGDVAAGAMAFLANTQAIIIDLRHNQGGSPDMVQLLISYLLDEEPRELSGIYSRSKDSYTPYWTLSDVPGRRMPDKAVYVLISGMTYSGAESLTYDLQAIKRATIVGEKSRGGAHLVDFQRVADEYIFTLPIARAVNPITGTNWEGSGVIPDVDLPQEKALEYAHKDALTNLLHQATEVDERRFLEWEMESLEAKLNPVTIDEEILQVYTGHFGDREILLKGGVLYCHQYTRLPLTPLNGNTFILTDDTRLYFASDAAASVTALIVLDRDGNEEPVPRTQ